MADVDTKVAETAPKLNELPQVDFGEALGNPPTGPRAIIGDPALQLGPGTQKFPEVTVKPSIDPTKEILPELNPPVAVTDSALKPLTPADKPDIKITAGSLELSYNDPQFERKLAYAGKYHANDFNALKLSDIPQGTKITPWVNSNGFYFWFNNNTSTPKELHYIPPNVTRIDAAGSLDMTKARVDILAAYDKRVAEQVTGTGEQFGGFLNFDRRTDPSRDGATTAINYFRNMSTHAGRSLDTLERSLTEAVKTSPNPYLKIWLGDVYVGQAMRHVQEEVTSGRAVNLQDPYITSRIDAAISLNRAARVASDDQLLVNGMKRQGNAYLPLSPMGPYWDRRSRDGYYQFWGGSGDQATYREASLTLLKGMMRNNSLPLQLPPFMPPRKY